jgi:hypothetical protein
MLSGETNMVETLEVQALAYLMGYPEAAWWVEYFPNVYIAAMEGSYPPALRRSTRETGDATLHSRPISSGALLTADS